MKSKINTNKMMSKLMLSCQTATELMEKKHRAKLTFGEKMQLAFHTAMCDACRRYEKQSHFIERIFLAKKEETLKHDMGKETKALEEKIIRKLDSK